VSLDGGYVPLQGGKLACSVGIETRGGVFTPLIHGGRAVPCELSETFTTADDGQLSIKITVLHSPTGRMADAQPLGRFELMLNESSPRGVPQIRVTFSVGTGGRFTLSAIDGGGREIWIAPA
jgi:molecular chaperone DnaK (HSP70)